MGTKTIWKGKIEFGELSCLVAICPSFKKQMDTHKIINRVDLKDFIEDFSPVDGSSANKEGESSSFNQFYFENLEKLDFEQCRQKDPKLVIDGFMNAGDVDWLWLDQPHTMEVAGSDTDEIYIALQTAMRQSHSIGFGILDIYTQKQMVLIDARQPISTLWTLNQEMLSSPDNSMSIAKNWTSQNEILTQTFLRLIYNALNNWTHSPV